MIAASGIPSLLARSPTTVFTALAVNAYKSVLEAQRKLCLAFLTSDDSCDESDKNLTSSCLTFFLSHPSLPLNFFLPPFPVHLPPLTASVDAPKTGQDDLCYSCRPPGSRHPPLKLCQRQCSRSAKKQLSWTSVARCLYPDAQTSSSQIATTLRHLLLQPG